ncbi:cellulose synthase family protein [Luteibaculum oceani]|uniref:Glycosyltransferase n=1 Tax=Luteibaculum oceani TaxID=1294296 RepID=A0A5C6UVJ9_9FLAO|nr:cellulose synthase family protein [Luteibaculum oceani]TXC76999.1 glycosyltransferase [Luteibaculum oceani]
MIVILATYGILLLFISVYVSFQLIHWVAYKRANKGDKNSSGFIVTPEVWPMVTVQLPLFNEKFVVERLIDAVDRLDYPTEKLEIQILDDSTDETTEIIGRKLNDSKLKHSFLHVRRDSREGYKAGALQYGMDRCNGVFIAIFDADFIPPADYLKNTIPQFQSEKIGMVQARWGHINQNDSLLTQMQAFGLDAHFTIEQVGRNAAEAFINFNGTAGVWRKTCIYDSGGWSHDTLTEDLDLSYRAQIRGWKFVYDEQIEVPAELPSNMAALRGQQFRWTKGGAECLRKLVPVLLKSKVGFWQKINGLVHLSNSFLFLAILGCALLSVPSLFIKIHTNEYSSFFNWAGIFVSSLLALCIIYATAYQRTKGDLRGFWWRFPTFLSVSMGLSLHNAIAVLEGYMGKKSPFIRTPKAGDAEDELAFRLSYIKEHISPITWIELGLAMMFAATAVYGIYHLEFGLVPFHTMLAVGYFYIATNSLAVLRPRLNGALQS